MGMTVRRGPRYPNYQSTDPVVADVARALGMKPDSVHQLMYGRNRINRRCRVVLAALKRHGADERSASWSAPLRVALAGIEASPLTRQLLHDAQELDLAEDRAENEYRLTRSPAHARLWVRAIDRLVQKLLQLRDALVAEHNLEGDQ